MFFDEAAALKSAEGSLSDQFNGVVERAEAARESAAALARAYAEHLKADGDPREHPPVPSSYGASQLVNQEVGMNIVYRAWNVARGGTNPVSPVRNVNAWQVAEHMHEHIGQPVLLEDLRMIFNSQVNRKGTPDEVATAVMNAQVGTLIARKTKVGAKVAYVLREALDGEEPAKSTWSFPTEMAAAA